MTSDTLDLVETAFDRVFDGQKFCKVGKGQVAEDIRPGKNGFGGRQLPNVFTRPGLRESLRQFGSQ